MRQGEFFKNLGTFLIIMGVTALTVYCASFMDNILMFYKASVPIVLILSLSFILFDEDTGKWFGGIEPETMRGLGATILFNYIAVSYLISFAINWVVVLNLIKFTFIGLITLTIVIGLIILYLKIKGQKNANQPRPETAARRNPFLP